MNSIWSLWVCCPELKSGESGLLQSAPDLQCISAQMLTWRMLGKSITQLVIILATAFPFKRTKTFEFADPPIYKNQINN